VVCWEASDRPKLSFGQVLYWILGVLQHTENGMSNRIASNMFYSLNVTSQRETIVGRIVELLTERATDGPGIAVIDVFVVATTRHDRFGMPCLVRRQEKPSFVIVHTKVSFAINTPRQY